MALTQAQIQEYYATEGNKANPLSPTAWLAAKTGASATATPKTNSNLSQSQLNTIESQIAGIRKQVQSIATQIPAATLKTPEKSPLPEETPNSTPYSGITAGATSAIDAYTKNMADLMKSYTANVPQYPDLNSIYENLYSELGLDSLKSERNEKTAIINTATNELNNINAQIKAVNDEATAASLQLEKNAATGSDITSAFLGRQQTEISRNAAIKALPLQSQALVASAKVAAAQGDQQLAQDMLDQAESKLSTLFQIRSEYETQKYQYKQNLIDNVFQYATDMQKVLLQAKLDEESRDYEQYQLTLSNQQDLAKEAMSVGDYYTASKISALNPKSATYLADLARLQASITPVASATPSSTSIVNTNGHSYLINDMTGDIIKDLGVANSEISSGGSGGLSLKETAVSSMMSQLTGVMGSDGYISPESWSIALNAWLGEGLNLSDFINNFKVFANPAHLGDYKGLGREI